MVSTSKDGPESYPLEYAPPRGRKDTHVEHKIGNHEET